jgi:hypothetical protein
MAVTWSGEVQSASASLDHAYGGKRSGQVGTGHI